jgi:hypothetical protein
MQDNIEHLLCVLEQHETEKCYASVVDLLWFLCNLFDDIVVQTSTDHINRLCQVATKLFSVIDRQVQYADIDVEFRNHLHQLGRALWMLSQSKSDVDPQVRTSLKRLLDGALQTKPVRSVIWDDPAQLNWQTENIAPFRVLEHKRLELRQSLNQEIQLLSLNASAEDKQAAYCKTVQCYGRMLFPWFSVWIYQRPAAEIQKADVVKLLAPLEPLINSLLPFLTGDEQALGWELVQIYGFWIRDRSMLPLTPKDLDECILVATQSASSSLVALSYCARLVTGNAYHNNEAALLTLCGQVLLLEKSLLKTISLCTNSPMLFADHRDTLQQLRDIWQAPAKKSETTALPPRKRAATKVNGNPPVPTESIVQIQQTFSQRSIGLMQQLLAESVALLGTPPGKFALLLLGSSSRQDRLPYSDIECALIYEATPEQSVQMRGYLYILLSLLEFAVIRLGETHDFNRGGYAGFHFDSSDHVLTVKNKLIGTADELYRWHIESTMLQSPGDLVLSGDLGEESKGQLLYAMLSPCLVNDKWDGKSLFWDYQNKIELLLNTPVDEWTHQSFKLAYFENQRAKNQQHILSQNPITDIPKKRSSQEEWPSESPDDFEAPEKVTLVTLRQIIALYCCIDILRKAERMLLETKQTTKNHFLPDTKVNLKDIYHKPLVYLALNLQLFLGTREKHPIHMFEAAFTAGILPFGTKVLLQEMLGSIIQMRSDLHLNKGAQEEAIEPKNLSSENQMTLEMIERVLIRPLKIAMETVLGEEEKTNDTLSSVAWSRALRDAFNKMWMHYSKERMGWQTRLPTHPLLVCLADHPGSDGTRLSTDEWLAQKTVQQHRLLLDIDSEMYQEKAYRKQPIVLIESVKNYKKIMRRLNPAAVAQLIEKRYLTLQGALQFSAEQIDQEKGRHLVMSVTLPTLNENPAFSLYLKVYPEMPALELAMTEFALLLTGPHLPWVELVRLTVGGKSYPVLFSQGIEGTLLSDVLQSPHPMLLAPSAYSQRVLLSLFLNQEDAKPSNLIAKPARDFPNQIELVSIDNDRSFYPGLLYDVTKQQLIPQVKDITFCFDAMNNPIDSRVREAFLALNPYALLSFWLMLGQRSSHDLEILFPEKEVIQHFPKSGISRQLQSFGRFFSGVAAPEESILSLMLQKGLLETLYTKMKRLQAKLHQAPQATHLDLLKTVEPYLASYYEKLLRLPEQPYQRFYRGFGHLYDEINTPDVSSEKSCKELPTQMPTLLTFETQQGKAVTIDELLSNETRHLKDSINELEITHKTQTQWRSILADLQSNPKKFAVALAAFKALPGDLKTKVINHLDFCDVLKGGSLQAQPVGQVQILGALIESPPHYQTLYFRKCTVLTDKILEKLLSRLPLLESLSLVSCPNVTTKAMSVVGQYVPGLRRLVLQDLSWAQITTKIDVSSRFSWFEPMGMDQVSEWSTLETLVVRDCKNLSMSLWDLLRFDLPRLTHLEITVKESQMQIQRSLKYIHQKFPLLKNAVLHPFFEDTNFREVEPNKNATVVNVILYGNEHIPYGCRHLIKDHVSAEKLQVCFHEIPSDAPEKLSKKYFGDIVIAFIIFDAKKQNSIEKIPHMAAHLRSMAHLPLPIVTLSITKKPSLSSLPDIGSIADFAPGDTIPFKEIFFNLTNHVASGTLLFHQKIIHQLETHQLSSTDSYFTIPRGMFIADTFLIKIVLPMICMSITREKKMDYIKHYVTDGYKFMVSTKTHIFNGVTCVEQLWDAPTREQERSESNSYIRNAAAIYNFVPLDDTDSFKKGVDCGFGWQNRVRSNAAIVCIGINSERRAIPTEQAYQAAKKKGYDAYFECSAKTGDGIDDTFKSSFELTIAKNGFWGWLGKSYICSASLKKGLILKEEKLLNPKYGINENETFALQKENVIEYENTMGLPFKAMSGSENNTLLAPLSSGTQIGFASLSPYQPTAFKRLFLRPITQADQEAHLKLFGFFSVRDRKSFGCVSQSCHAVQKEMDTVYEKNFC